MQKTNKNWYPYKEFGSYYKLEDGTLLFAAMMNDGSIDMDGDEVNYGEVDWDNGVDDEEERMKEIVKELEARE